MPNTKLVFCLLAVAAASAALVAADVVHTTPKSHLKRRLPAKGTVPLFPPFVPIYTAEQQAYVKAHNDLRRKVGAPALEWSAFLTADAHSWAEQRRGDCNYRLHSKNKHGENIYWKSYKEFTPHDVVQWWFNESRFYDSKRHICMCRPEKEGCECGHYLAVVWSTTKRVGCSGAVYCDDQQGVIVVCNYDPPASLQAGVNPLNAAPAAIPSRNKN